MCNPQPVPGRPDLITVDFFGERRNISRNFYEKVMAINRAWDTKAARKILASWDENRYKRS